MTDITYPSQAEAPIANLDEVRVKTSVPSPEDELEAEKLQAEAVAAADELEQAYRGARILKHTIDRTYGAVQVEHAWRRLKRAIRAYGQKEIPQPVNEAIARAAEQRPRTQARAAEFRPIPLRIEPFPYNFEAHMSKNGMSLYYRTKGPRSPLRRVHDDRAIAKAYLQIMKMFEPQQQEADEAGVRTGGITEEPADQLQAAA